MGSPSQGIGFIEKRYIIALDSKARLVLPLELRDALGIKNRDKILLSVSAGRDGRVIIELAKANGALAEVKCSRNCAYLKEGERDENHYYGIYKKVRAWQDAGIHVPTAGRTAMQLPLYRLLCACIRSISEKG